MGFDSWTNGLGVSEFTSLTAPADNIDRIAIAIREYTVHLSVEDLFDNSCYHPDAYERTAIGTPDTYLTALVRPSKLTIL